MNKYYTIFRLAVVHSLKNYKGLIGLSLFLITCLLIFSHLWKISALKMGAAHLDPAHLLWYIALNEWVLIAVPDIPIEMEQDLRSGKLAYLLPRPLSYLGATFAEAFGVLFVNTLLLGAVAFLFTWASTGILLPNLLLLFFLGLLAGAVCVIFKMIVGLSAFWLQEVAPFDWIWDKLLFALGGLILPLAVYPSWIQKIAYCTPFPAILGQRSALALDFSLALILHVAASLLLWGVFALVCLKLLYRRGLSILNLEGG